MLPLWLASALQVGETDPRSLDALRRSYTPRMDSSLRSLESKHTSLRFTFYSVLIPSRDKFVCFYTEGVDWLAFAFETASHSTFEKCLIL